MGYQDNGNEDLTLILIYDHLSIHFSTATFMATHPTTVYLLTYLPNSYSHCSCYQCTVQRSVQLM